MTILLTGATGFLGSYLLDSLISNGYKVVILKRSNSDTSRIKHLFADFKSYDVDSESFELAFENNIINCIIHTACNYGRRGDSPHRVLETNLMFGLRVLEAGIKHKVETFINTDSFLPKHINSYSLSKNHFFDWLQFNSKNLRIINLKLENFYGPEDDETKFVGWLLSQFNKRVDEIQLTSGNQKRDFIYIQDVVSAYLTVLSKVESLPNIIDFQVGTGTSIKVKDFVLKLKKTYEDFYGSISSKLIFGAIPYREGELMDIKVDNYRLKDLGWHPEINLHKGLELTIKRNK